MWTRRWRSVRCSRNERKSLSIQTISKDNVRNLTETIPLGSAPVAWRLEAIVYCASGSTRWVAATLVGSIVRCAEEEVQPVKSDLAERPSRRVSAVVEDDLCTGRWQNEVRIRRGY